MFRKLEESKAALRSAREMQKSLKTEISALFVRQKALKIQLDATYAVIQDFIEEIPQERMKKLKRKISRLQKEVSGMPKGKLASWQARRCAQIKSELETITFELREAESLEAMIEALK